MDIVLDLASRARKMPLNALTPGFSLIDGLEPSLRKVMEDAQERDPSAFARRLSSGRIRVTLTTPSPAFIATGMKANRVVDDFESSEHLVAACILSSWVPAVTGPLRPATDSAVGRATQKMASAWGVKRCQSDGPDLEPVAQLSSEEGSFIDGGLSAMWPMADQATVLVSPLAIRAPHSTSQAICPPADFRRQVYGGQGIWLDASVANLSRVAQMTWSPTETELEGWFRQGHDDATRFVREGGTL